METYSVFTPGIGESASNPTKQRPDASEWAELADYSSCSEAQRQSTANRGKGRASLSRFRSCRRLNQATRRAIDSRGISQLPIMADSRVTEMLTREGIISILGAIQEFQTGPAIGRPLHPRGAVYCMVKKSA
jgi:hypothetical protein